MGEQKGERQRGKGLGKRTKIVLASAAGLLSLLVLAGLVAWRMLPGLILDEVKRQASQHGVELEGCTLEIDWDLPRPSALHLSGCKFSLARAPYVTGEVDSIVVELVDLAPKRVLVTGLDTIVRGSPTLDELLEYRRPGMSELELRVRDSRLRWYASDSERPRLALAGISYDAPGGNFDAQVDVEGVLVGDASRRGPLVELELALADNPSAKLNARIEQDKSLAELRVEFERLALSELDGPFLSIPKPLGGVKVDAKLYAQLPIGMTMKPAKGDVRLTLHGLNFPVPRELEGLVYGTPAELSANFTLDRGFTRASLSKLRFEVGALSMTGDGKLALEGVGLAYELAMAGSLSCAAIVQSAATAHAGSSLAKVAGQIAKKTLGGSVRILAFISGHSSQLAETKVIKSVGVGCGLKPELVEELKQLPGRLLEQLPELPELEGLPTPTPPKFELPRLPKLPFPERDKRLEGAPTPNPPASEDQ